MQDLVGKKQNKLLRNRFQFVVFPPDSIFSCLLFYAFNFFCLFAEFILFSFKEPQSRINALLRKILIFPNTWNLTQGHEPHSSCFLPGKCLLNNQCYSLQQMLIGKDRIHLMIASSEAISDMRYLPIRG
jgi:hypothetical protein